MNRYSMAHRTTSRLIYAIWALACLTLCTVESVEAQNLENPTKLYTGAISDPSGTAIDGGMLYVFDEPYPEPVSSSRVGEQGYRVLLDPAKLYRFRVEVPGFHTGEILLSSPNGSDYQEVTENIELSPIPMDTSLALGTLFVGETDELVDGVLAPALAFMLNAPYVNVTMSVGLVEDAVDPLSNKRVAAIKSAFRSADVDLTRLAWHCDLSRPLHDVALKISSFSSVE